MSSLSSQKQFSWDEQLKSLKRFKKIFGGSSHVPRAYVDDNGFCLGAWCQYLRKAKQDCKLDQDKVEILEKEIGFSWEDTRPPARLSWEAKVRCLRNYQQVHGDCKVPRSYIDDTSDFHLEKWLYKIHRKKREGKLSQEQIQDLELIPGFQWTSKRWGYCAQMTKDDPLLGESEDFDTVSKVEVTAPSTASTYQAKLACLQQFCAEHGHCQVPTKFANPAHGFHLGVWVGYLRRRRKEGNLSEDQIAELDNLGMIWDASCGPVTPWQDKIKALQKFYQEFGHCNVPTSYIVESSGFKIGKWIHKTRQQYKERKLSPEQVKELESVGFEWEGPIQKLKLSWPEQLDIYERFQKEHNQRTRVPNEYVDKATGFQLGSWMVRTRKAQLSPQKIKDLEKLNFPFQTVYDLMWKERYEALKHFRERTGHVLVPGSHMEKVPSTKGKPIALGRWVRDVRKRKEMGTLTEGQISDLDRLGFVWNVPRTLLGYIEPPATEKMHPNYSNKCGVDSKTAVHESKPQALERRYYDDGGCDDDGDDCFDGGGDDDGRQMAAKIGDTQTTAANNDESESDDAELALSFGLDVEKERRKKDNRNFAEESKSMPGHVLHTNQFHSKDEEGGQVNKRQLVGRMSPALRSNHRALAVEGEDVSGYVPRTKRAKLTQGSILF